MDQAMTNEVRAQNLRETFDQAIVDGDWPVARETLSLMEDMRISTYEFRREMSQAMFETDDITYEPFEVVIPVASKEDLAWGGRSNLSTFGMGDESLEQNRLSAEYGNHGRD